MLLLMELLGMQVDEEQLYALFHKNGTAFNVYIEHEFLFQGW